VTVSETLLTNARIFDGSGATLRDGLEVLIAGARIAAIAPRVERKPDTTVIDLGGRTLMPGLIDAHYHAYATAVDLAKAGLVPRSLHALEAHVLLEDTLQRGFTTVRDAGGADLGLAVASERGLIRGPRIFYSGHALTQTGGHGDLRNPQHADPCACGQAGSPLSTVVDGVDEVRKAAREELRKGATQIKIFVSGGISSPSDPVWMRQFTEEEIRAAVEEAASRRTYVLAHAYTAESISRAVRCGVRSIEHGNLIDRAAAELVREHGAFVVPTLVTYEANFRHGAAAGAPAFMLEKLDQVRLAGLDALVLLAEVGVNIGFGTDLLGPLHRYQSDEFTIRAQVQKPIDILRSATSVNAALLQRPDELGVVKAGALADLIAVDGDPLTDIAVLTGQGERIPLVIKNGEILKRIAI
jgi:imidazolonepropionase-like amidohydrolase